MEFVTRSRFCCDLKYFVEYAELQWHTWNGEWWLEYKICEMQCNLSLIELELTIENTIYTINCTQSDIFISFQKIPDDDESLLSWLLKQSSWDNRDLCFCFSCPFSSLFSVLALSSCARVRSLPKSKCSEVTAKQARSKDICSYVPMYPCPYTEWVSLSWKSFFSFQKSRDSSHTSSHCPMPWVQKRFSDWVWWLTQPFPWFLRGSVTLRWDVKCSEANICFCVCAFVHLYLCLCLVV